MLVCGDFFARRTLIRNMWGTHPQIFDRLLEAVQGMARYQGVCPDVGLRDMYFTVWHTRTAPQFLMIPLARFL